MTAHTGTGAGAARGAGEGAALGGATLPRGARLGVDVGKARIGLAASDPDGLIATPVETVARVLDATGTDSADVRAIAEAVGERFAAVVYVGLPRHLSGKEGAATADARAFATRLALAVAPVPVRMVDERMSTVTATSQLRAAGKKSKSHRPVIDQAAAVIILQSALDAERAAGTRAGEAVETAP
ncbi:Holliday junction resolvase YqgF [Xylanimonas cellulosilytica DSM 15894]|uniref:Putative pre-16S rRNA nuclease n=1 Tax=Xylanimonas cellulosilytica (strain DSM 15894 / JCM 12276 / CECT 5975 / KCTC 9989 / LMG 20990 / NBRC 107835 / XIL07) TaxID=446471 RepID=D1BSM1_XYLCX|nr:Holliday junction resolvase RuvX [Xylanimonas cellulosilytica]ACZ30713.1 Holliday junction resolvase YqgF [Xylanimonas cellulosilytica DSM 15894]